MEEEWREVVEANIKWIRWTNLARMPLWEGRRDASLWPLRAM